MGGGLIAYLNQSNTAQGEKQDQTMTSAETG